MPAGPSTNQEEFVCPWFEPLYLYIVAICAGLSPFYTPFKLFLSSSARIWTRPYSRIAQTNPYSCRIAMALSEHLD